MRIPRAVIVPALCLFLLPSARSFANELHDAVKKGDKAEVEKILNAEPDLVFERDDAGCTPLHYAAQGGRLEIIRLLLDRKADVNARENSKETPLHWGWQSEAVVELLLANGADVRAADKNGETPLHRAALGNRKVAEMLLAKGADINAKTKDGRTPLHCTFTIELADYLISKGADVNARDDAGHTLLYGPAVTVAYAPLTGQDPEPERKRWDFLVTKGAKPDVWTTTLMSKKKELADLLKDNPKAVNARDGEGQTPLHMAAAAGLMDMVKFLLDMGADIEVIDAKGWPPLANALESHHEDIAILLIDKGADVKWATLGKGKTSPLHMAIGCHEQVLKKLIDAGADVNARDRDGSTPLHSAVYIGHLPTVKLLLAHGADRSLADDRGVTPAQAAAKSGFMEMAALLQPAGPGQEMMAAAAEGDQEKIIALLAKDPGLARALTQGGQTALHVAAEKGNAGVVKRLLKAGADPASEDAEGRPPLLFALMYDHDLVAEILLDAGAPANLKNRERVMPIQLAVSRGKTELVRRLLDKGAPADGHGLDPAAMTFLHDAVRNGNYDMAEMLIAKGADVNGRDRGSYTPLHYAVSRDQEAVVWLLVEKGADVNAKDKDKRTPIWMTLIHNLPEMERGYAPEDERDAIQKEREGIALFLIEKGAKVSAPRSDGMTPLGLATKLKDGRMMDFLKKNGGK